MRRFARSAARPVIASRDRDGYEHYAGNPVCLPGARRILARERSKRLSVPRMWRMAWALG
jgi:hypothetical protein